MKTRGFTHVVKIFSQKLHTTVSFGVVITSILLPLSGLAGATVVGWGFNGQGQINIPPGLTNMVAVAAGGQHSLALKSDGMLVGWGDNYYRQATPPAGLSNVMAVSCGWFYSLVLKSNGTLVAWGDNGYGQTNVPSGLSNVVAIAAGDQFGLALKSDGRVVGWGYNAAGNASPPASLNDAVAIAAGIAHGVALRKNGTVMAWGYNAYGQTNVPVGLSNVVAIGAGQAHCLAVRDNGTVVAWGLNWFGQSTPPPDLSNVVSVASGLGNQSLALRKDGTVIGWGLSGDGQASTPAGLRNVIALSMGGAHSLALTNQSPVAQCTNVFISATTNCAVGVTVNFGSFDPDGDAITVSQYPPGPYPVGASQVMLVVTDEKGASSSCSATVTVLDTAPPVILDAAADLNVLWPLNHQMFEVNVSAVVVDQCGAATWRIVSVQSNEPAIGPGEGKGPDWLITGDHTVALRSERSPRGTGRVYYLELQAEDDAGNLSEPRIVMVSVPKSAEERN